MPVMDGVFVEPLVSSEAVRDPAALATRLLAENDQLRSEIDGLRRENPALRQQAGYWQSMHARAAQRLEQMHQELELLRGEIRHVERERTLVAAIELVSPANKDRPESGQAVVAKRAALLRKGIAVSLVDLVIAPGVVS